VARIKGQKPLTPAERQEIARRYEAGEGLEVLIAEYQRGKPKIKQVVQEAGVAIRPRGNRVGNEWPPERRDAHRLATSTPEFAVKARAATLARLAKVRESPAVNTAIERRLHDALKVARIGFRTQSILLGTYLVDIEIHQAPVVIEADGQVHSLPQQKAKDALRDAALAEAGYRVFRFTGSEINTDAVACIQRVITACRLAPDEEPVYDIRTKFSGELHPLWKGGKQEFVCETCGDTFLAQPKHRTGEHVYCSRQCTGKARVGVKRGPFSAEHRAKISAGKKRYHQIKVESDLRGDAQRAAETTVPATLF
jgi:very-short-patch-repair endonuclease